MVLFIIWLAFAINVYMIMWESWGSVLLLKPTAAPIGPWLSLGILTASEGKIMLKSRSTKSRERLRLCFLIGHNPEPRDRISITEGQEKGEFKHSTRPLRSQSASTLFQRWGVGREWDSNMSMKSELYSFAFIYNAKGSRCHCSGETLNEYHVVTLQSVNLRRKGCLVQRKLNECIVF